jgi:C1A family cysteine protease
MSTIEIVPINKYDKPPELIPYRINSWIPDLPDSQDLDFGQVFPKRWYERLPAQVDLTSKCTSVSDQGQVGSCIAHAVTDTLEFLEIKNYKGASLQKDWFDMSRLYVYYYGRIESGIPVTADIGCYIRQSIKAIKKYGICKEVYWPYIPSKFSVEPDQISKEQAKNFQLIRYYRLYNLSQMMKCLSDGFPFVFGISTYPNMFQTPYVRSGNIPMPQGNICGGHAMLAVGYDTKKKVFLIKNSWGTSWGRGGYGTIPFDYLDNRNLSDDFWTIREVTNL